MGNSGCPTRPPRQSVLQRYDAFRSLEKSQRLRDELAREHREAQRSEAQAAIDRQRYQERASQLRSELVDAQKHLGMVREQRSTTVQLLGERERERRGLLQSHTELALELERLKLDLSSGGEAGGSVQSTLVSPQPCMTTSDLAGGSPLNVPPSGLLLSPVRRSASAAGDTSLVSVANAASH